MAQVMVLLTTSRCAFHSTAAPHARRATTTTGRGLCLLLHPIRVIPLAMWTLQLQQVLGNDFHAAEGARFLIAHRAHRPPQRAMPCPLRHLLVLLHACMKRLDWPPSAARDPAALGDDDSINHDAYGA